MVRTRKDLKYLQNLPLEVKEKKALISIERFLNEHDAYISYSGGVDSEVLLHLVRRVKKNTEAMYIDTGLEFPENRAMAKSKDNIVFVKPTMPFYEVIEQYGYPVVSKEQSQFIYEYKTTQSQKLREYRLNGNKYGRGKISRKHIYLLDAPFKISHFCCKKLKREPSARYESETGKKPFIGTLAEESELRTQKWLKHGCNALEGRRPISTPLAIFLKSDIHAYIRKYNLDYSRAYAMGYERTGCMFCLYGLEQEGCNNRFVRMKQTHKRQYDYCMNTLGIKEVLDYMQLPY